MASSPCQDWEEICIVVDRRDGDTLSAYVSRNMQSGHRSGVCQARDGERRWKRRGPFSITDGPTDVQTYSRQVDTNVQRQTDRIIKRLTDRPKHR